MYTQRGQRKKTTQTEEKKKEAKAKEENEEEETCEAKKKIRWPKFRSTEKFAPNIFAVHFLIAIARRILSGDSISSSLWLCFSFVVYSRLWSTWFFSLSLSILLSNAYICYAQKRIQTHKWNKWREEGIKTRNTYRIQQKSIHTITITVRSEQQQWLQQ